MVLFVMVMIFATVGLGTYFFVLLGNLKRQEEEDRLLRRLGVRVGEAEVEQESVAAILRDNTADFTAEYLGEYGERLQTLITAADRDTTVTQVVVQIIAFGIAAAVGGAFAVGPMAVVIFPVGAYIPYFLLNRAANKRAQALLSQLPDALEMMSRAMQTGTGLSETFRLAAEEMPEPVASEFGRIYEEVRFGKDWRVVLNGLVERNPTIFDLRLFVSTLLLQKDTGGNMIETLSNISKTIRTRYVFDAKVKAMTSEARASGMVLAVMPLGVIVLIFLANPEYLYPLFQATTGNIILLVAAAQYGVGLYAMQTASQVEV
jgi:tight adherence protein B